MQLGIWPLFLSIWGGLRSQERHSRKTGSILRQLGNGLQMINKRHPSVAHLILNDLTQDRPSHHLSALVQAEGRVADVGFHPPS